MSYLIQRIHVCYNIMVLDSPLIVLQYYLNRLKDNLIVLRYCFCDVYFFYYLFWKDGNVMNDSYKIIICLTWLSNFARTCIFIILIACGNNGLLAISLNCFKNSYWFVNIRIFYVCVFVV